MEQFIASILLFFSTLFGVATPVATEQPQTLGASVFVTQQGGTGTSSPSGILYGDNGATNSIKTVLVGTGLSFSGGTLSATGGSGTVTQINTTFPILGGPITTTGTLTFDGLSTTTPWTTSGLAFVVNNNTLSSVATGTVASGNGISVTAGQSIIGSGLTIANTGVLSNVAGSGITVSGATGNVTIAQNDRETIATTTGLTISQVAFYTKVGGLTTLGGVSTTSLSAGSGITTSATLGALLGGSNATLSVNDRDEIATTTDIAISQIAYWTKTGGLSTLASVATGTVSAGNGISLDSSVRSVIGGALQITNSGVLSITATSPLARDTATGAVTISCPTCSSSANIIATTTDIAVPQLAYFTKTGGNTTLGSVATGTISSANTALTVTGSRFSVGGATTFTVSTTTSNMFTGIAGQILAYTNLGWISQATTTAGTGLTYTGTAFNVNTSQNIATLSNLTTNGIVRTSGGNGTLNVDIVQANMLLSGNNSNVVVATSTPTMDSFYATSTTATSSIAARLLIGAQNTNFYPNAPLTITGNVNNTFQTVLQNLNAGATAGTDLILGGNLMTNTTYYGNLGYNSSANAEAGYTAFAPNDLYLYNNDASLDLATASTTNANAHIKFFTNGTLVANERMRLTSNGLGIGTTTPRWQLQIASTTGPQIAIGDLLTTTDKWTIRGINNNFYIATSSAGTYATSTTAALAIDSDGSATFAATTTAQKLVANARFVITALSSFVASIIGQLGLDTTSEQLRYNAGTTYGEQVALRMYEPSYSISSTTQSNIDSVTYQTGTTTRNVGNKLLAYTLIRVYCKSTNNTALVQVGSGTASSTGAGSQTQVFCTPQGTSFTPTSNNTFATRANILVGVGSATTTDPNGLTITLTLKETAD